jgi:hypothetical protein
MIESKERAMQFEKELKALLKKYNTEIEVEDKGLGYSSDYVMTVYIPSKWDNENNCIAESAELNLGTYYDGD